MQTIRSQILASILSGGMIRLVAVGMALYVGVAIVAPAMDMVQAVGAAYQQATHP